MKTPTPALLLSLCLVFASCGHGSASGDGKLYANLNIITQGWSWMWLQDGKAYFGPGTMPPGGPDKLDPTAFAAKFPDNVADYQLTADKLTLHYKNGKQEVRDAKQDSSGLLLDGMPWAQLIPLGDGAPLDGSFEWSFSASDVQGASTITYDKSGKFTEHVLVGVTTNNPLVGGESDTHRHGTYAVQGFTMTMKYSDGKTETFPVATIDKSIPALYLEASVHNRAR